MVVIGTLLILAVLADAWRRIYQDRRAPVRMKLSRGESGEEEGRSPRDVDLAWLKELPNGGARVVNRDASMDGSEDGAEQDFDEAVEASRPASPQPASASRTVPRAEPRDDKPAPRAGAAEREASPPAAASRPVEPKRPEPPRVETPAAPAKPEAAPATARHSARSGEDEVELFSGMSSDSDEPENLDWLDALEADPKPEPQHSAQAHLPRDIASEVFMLNVVARDPQGFRGDDILQILLACGLRFGDMSFFHRHEHDTGKGPIQFSVANMLQPGVFDIDRMEDFTTKGLVFFVTLPGPDDMMKAYDYMLETAQAVARNLKGDVLDETRSVLTRQTLEHARQQIRDLERRLLAKAR
ncbi:hypothetical protein GCM10027297_13300 [Parahaliea aestuarii]